VNAIIIDIMIKRFLKYVKFQKKSEIKKGIPVCPEKNKSFLKNCTTLNIFILMSKYGVMWSGGIPMYVDDMQIPRIKKNNAKVKIINGILSGILYIAYPIPSGNSIHIPRK